MRNRKADYLYFVSFKKIQKIKKKKKKEAFRNITFIQKNFK